MSNTQLLEYGFVVDVDGSAVYDHVVNARLQYADALLDKLRGDKYPTIAKRSQVAVEEGVQSPVFSFKSLNGALESFQSAYYLADALTRKGVLPVYFPDTGEVKNLMPLLSDEERMDASAVIQILRARYITPEIRHPQRGFLQQGMENQAINSEMIDISEEDILKIFGRLPAEETLEDIGKSEEDSRFISDRVAGIAS